MSTRVVGGEDGGKPATATMDEIIVGKRFRHDLGDIDGLAASIERTGLLHAIVITSDGRLIAGYRRIEAFRRLGRTEVPVRILDVDDLLQAEHDENVFRKGWTASEAVAIARALEDRVAARAEERRLANLKRGPAASERENFPLARDGRVRDQLAARVGLSGRTLQKAAAVVAAAEQSPEKYQHLVEEMDRTGSVDRAYRRLRAAREALSATATTPSEQASPNAIGCLDALTDIARDADALRAKITTLVTALAAGIEPVLGRDVRPTMDTIWSLIPAVDRLVHAADRRGACLLDNGWPRRLNALYELRSATGDDLEAGG